MTTPRKIASLLIAMEAGEELKLKSGHTLAMASNDEPGFMMFDSNGYPTGELFQVGSETAYMFLVEHARSLTEQDIKTIEDKLVEETQVGLKERL